MKTKYGADKTESENKILVLVELLKKTDCNTNITKIENKTPSISSLVTNSALTAVEGKIPSASNLVEKKQQIMT